MIFELFKFFLIPVLLTIVITPVVIKLAKIIGAMDLPNERKVHTEPTPRLGGVAIYLSFFLSLVSCYYIFPSIHPFTRMTSQTIIMLGASLSLVLFLGIWDDLKQLTPGRKLIVQIIAAAIVYFAGFRISSITSPMDLNLLNLGIFDFPATIIWIVLITNAFNLIDGLDGLASGVAFIVALTISTVSFLKGDIESATLSLMLAGATLGFLRYNFNKAKIFLGDSGSLFIGFSLAILSMQSSTKGSTVFSLLVPVIALGLPIMDTMLSMIRRFLRSVLPEQQEPKSFIKKVLCIFNPDRGHIHHQLISLGFSHKKVVLLLYIVSILFGIGAFAVTISNTFNAIWIFMVISIATAIGISRLRYKEMAIFRNGVLLPIYERPIINNTFFIGFMDLVFIVIAFSVSTFLSSNQLEYAAFDKGFFSELALVCGIQLGVFYLGGLYKETYRQFGVGDFLKTLKIVTFSVVFFWIIFALLYRSYYTLNITLLTLDFYLLLSFIAGSRFSFHILNFLSKNNIPDWKKRVLVYGASARGISILQQILQETHLPLQPVGFLDDNPQLEGKRINGYQVFGGHWKLERLINTMQISEIIICDDEIKTEILRRVQKIARSYGVIIRKARVQLDQVVTVESSEKVLRDQISIFADGA